MAAAAIVGAALVASRGLSLWMEGVDVHGEVESVPDCLHVVSVELIGAIDALRMPVRPV